MPRKEATRKFTPAEAVQNNAHGSEAESNSDLIVDQASSLKALAIVVDQAAAAARTVLAQTRVSVGREPAVAESDVRNTAAVFSDSDLRISQQISARGIDEQISRATLPGISLVGMEGKLSLTAASIVQSSISNFFSVREQLNIQAPNSAVPLIDHITVELDKARGTVDCFYARVAFSLPFDQVRVGNVKAIRIFRSTINDPEFARNKAPLSSNALGLLSTAKRSTRLKTNDSTSSIEQRMREAGMSNSLSMLNPVDAIRNIRVSIESEMTRVSPAPVSAARPKTDDRAEIDASSFIAPQAFIDLDRSVLNDLRSLRNIQVQNPTLRASFESDEISVGRKSIGKTNLLGDQQSKSFRDVASISRDLVVEKNNREDFRELAVMSPEKLSGKVIGDLIEYSFDDESISYGKAYRYYILTVDKNMSESIRSRIVEINVDGLRVPECPRRVNASVVQNSVSMAISVEDKLVEKFEIYRKEGDLGLTKSEVRTVSMLAGRSGATMERVSRFTLANNFIQVAESLVSSMGGSTYFDRQVIPGRKYVYRIYSVDIFGNKSECPRELEVFVPEPQLKPNELRKPSMTVEIDSKTNKTKVIFTANDKRVRSLFLERKDITIGQKSFTIPGAPTRTNWGSPSAGRTMTSFDGPKLSDKESNFQWNGHFTNEGDEITFVDLTSQIEHTYQYRIHGVDRLGNKTSHEISKPIFVVNRAFTNSPVSLSSSLVVDIITGQPKGVQLTWLNGDVDISAEDRMGSRSKLSDTSVRTLFQVERRRAGEDRWLEFPLTEEVSMFDPIQNGDEQPNFRPEYVRKNETYIYRVESIQSGGYISNFGTPLEVFAGLSVQTPSNFKLLPADTKVRPFYVMLNWDTTSDSGVVDRWEIERAEVNNFAATRLNLKNPDEFSGLKFRKFRTVFKESSRGRSVSSDDRIYKALPGLPLGSAISGRQIKLDLVSEKLNVRSAIQSGDHSFMDSSVQFGNTYVYRIRAISPAGEESAWALRGIRVSDDVFDRKLASIISEDEKIMLTSQLKPMVVKAEALSTSISLKSTSFSMLPSFARTSVGRSVSAHPDKHEATTQAVAPRRTNIDLRKK